MGSIKRGRSTPGRRRFGMGVGVLISALALLAFGLIIGAGAQGQGKGPKPKDPEKICEDSGDWVWDGTDWTLTGPNEFGSKKFDTTEDGFTTISAPNGYLISAICVKAGQNTVRTEIDPPAVSVDLTDHVDQDVSHFSLEFVKSTNGGDGEWCSPGYWRANAVNWGAVAWPVPTDTKYVPAVTNAVAGAPSPSAGQDPTLLEVLEDSKAYFATNQHGAAFNAVGTYLSLEAGLDVQFDANGNPIHNCPFNQQGERE